MRRFIAEAGQVHRSLAQFISTVAETPRFISLGENCTPAWYMKQLGLKTHSYPFDWTFSSPDIILHCLQDDFDTLLKRSKVMVHDGGKSAGHSVYHTHLFMHRNPRKDRNSHQYYVRCCERLREQLDSQKPVVYVMLLINEPAKRPLWANGFTSHFPMPKQRGYESAQPLIEYLRSRNQHAQMVVIEHETECLQTIACEQKSEHSFSIRFHAGGSSNGKEFVDTLDDFCFKLALSGLCG